MSSTQNLARNTASYISAMIIQKILSLLYFVFIARMIGVDDMGRFTFAMSFVAIFAIVLDLGLNNVLVREVAREPKNTKKFKRNRNCKICYCIFWILNCSKTKYF